MRRVEQIEELSPELQSHPIAQAGVLEKPPFEIDASRPDQNGAAGVAVRVQSRRSECGLVEPMVDGLLRTRQFAQPEAVWPVLSAIGGMGTIHESRSRRYEIR